MPETTTLPNGQTATLVDIWCERYRGFFTLVAATPSIKDIVIDYLDAKEASYAFFEIRQQGEMACVVSDTKKSDLEILNHFKANYNVLETDYRD